MKDMMNNALQVGDKVLHFSAHRSSFMVTKCVITGFKPLGPTTDKHSRPVGCQNILKYDWEKK